MTVFFLICSYLLFSLLKNPSKLCKNTPISRKLEEQMHFKKDKKEKIQWSNPVIP